MPAGAATVSVADVTPSIVHSENARSASSFVHSSRTRRTCLPLRWAVKPHATRLILRGPLFQMRLVIILGTPCARASCRGTTTDADDGWTRNVNDRAIEITAKPIAQFEGVTPVALLGRAARLDTNFVGIDDNWLQVECAQRARHIEGRRSGLQSDWCAWWELVPMTQPRKGLRSRGQRPAANDSSGVGSHRAVLPVRRRIGARYGMTPWREAGPDQQRHRHSQSERFSRRSHESRPCSLPVVASEIARTTPSRAQPPARKDFDQRPGSGRSSPPRDSPGSLRLSRRSGRSVSEFDFGIGFAMESWRGALG